jgi:hypothetical protein
MAHADLDDDESARPAPPQMSRGSQSIADHAGADGLTARRYGTMVFAAGAILLLPAVWSLFSAVWSAMTTGHVQVISLGRFETSRDMVHWTNGWARFVGPIALIASVGSRILARSLPWWPPAVLSVVGLALLLFSRWFTSPGGAALFISMAAYIALTALVDRKFGRGVATSMLLATVGLAVYVYISK